MTTVVYKDGVMCGDGQVTRYGSLIESESCVKVRNIGGVLVGGAGGGVSIMKFFDWFADKVESEWALAEYPNLNILPPEDLVEEDFQALVVSPDGSIFEYIGTKNIFPVTEEYASIGSGCLYAYPLLDAGFSARQAVEGAIKRCPFSGGLITEITFDEEGASVDKAMLESMSKEEIIKTLFPSEDVEDTNQVDCDGIALREFGAGTFSLTISADGIIADIEDTTWASFLDELETLPTEDLKAYADVLGVKYTSNMKRETLAKRLDEKVKEIVDSMQEES